MRTQIASILLLALMSTLPALPVQAGEVDPALDGVVHSAAECPALFGGQASITRNQEYRSGRLDEVIIGEHLVNLVYYGDWQTPRRIRFQGLEVLAAGGEDALGRHALVEIERMPEGIHCPTGRYLVRQDNSIGAGTQILAVVDDAILLAHQGELRFVTVSRKTDPDWRLIWRSTWTVAGTQPAGAPAPTNHSRPASSRVKSARGKPSARRPPRRPR